MNCYTMISNGKYFIYPAKPHSQVLSTFCFDDWQIKKIKAKGLRRSMFFFISFMLFYNNMMWLSYGISCLMSPFSLYQVKPSVKRVLDIWLGYRYKLIPQICVVHPHEQYSHGCDSLSSVLFWCTLHFVLYCTIDLSHTSLRLKVYLVISHGIK